MYLVSVGGRHPVLTRVRTDQGVSGWAFRHGEAVLVKDMLADPRILSTDELPAEADDELRHIVATQAVDNARRMAELLRTEAPDLRVTPPFAAVPSAQGSLFE